MRFYHPDCLKEEQTTLAKWYYCIALAWVDVEANFLGKACCKFPFKLSFQFKFY
ncbi:hypothetical protein AAG906_039697 [Vitis piasezkii]